MKYIAFLFVIILGVGCTQSKIENSYERGRFEEKMRWMDYQTNIKDPQILKVMLQYYLGPISKDSAFNKLVSIASDANPFYTTQKYK